MKDSINARLNHLKTLLKENYHRGFPILKELIQNADDAEASEMKIILTSGISDAEHPLLRHPILIVINNGMFSADDREAINQIGASAKVTQKSTVGRFGLGIKSLFHLCDCFFCLAPEHNSQLFSINPYSTANDQGKEFDERHKEWNVGFENDTKLVIELLMDYQANLETGLITIIPLRQKGDEPCLSKDYTPGDSAISLFDIFKVTSDQPDIITLAENLAPLFPMLRYLRQISFFSLDTKPPSQPSLELTCSAVTASGHMPFDEERMTKEQLLQFAGEVTLKFGRNKLGSEIASDTKYRYFGTAKWNTDQLFQAIKEQPEWPRQNGVDKNGDVLDEKEKASPHGSIIIGIFDRLVNQKPFVKITPAVFLPIGIAENIKPSISLYANVTTHGYWFVDSGRQHILGLKNTEAGEPQTIQENWNRLVAKHITFPLLIPTLAEFASQPGTKHQEIVEITQAIAESVWLKPNLGVICSEWQWICQLAHNGSKSYQKIKASNPVYLIAAPPESDPSRPFDVMPDLKDKDIACLIVTGDVHLLNSQNTRRLWPDHLIREVLESIEVEKTFTRENHLTYLRDFLQTIKSDHKSEQIIRLLKRAFSSVRYRNLTTNKKVVSEIVRFVDLSQRVRLSVPRAVTDAYEDLIKSLAERATWLCIPEDLCPADDSNNRKLSLNKVVDLVSCLAGLAAPKNSDWLRERSRLAAEIILDAEQNDPQVLRQIAGFALFQVEGFSEARGETRAYWSLDQLNTCKAEGRLFSKGNSGNRYAKYFVTAMGGEVTIVEGEVRDLLSRIASIENLRLSDIIQALLNHTGALGQNRMALLNELVKTVDDPVSDKQRRAIRYCLHGSKLARDTDDVLLYRIEQGSLESTVLESSRRFLPANFLVLSAELAANVAEKLYAQLGIETLNKFDTLFEKLEQVGEADLQQIDLRGLTDPDRKRLLRLILEERVFRALRLHKTDVGGYICLTKHSYLATEVALPDDLADEIYLIDDDGDADLHQKYTRFGIQEFTASVLIDHLLHSDKLSKDKRWQHLLDTLAHYQLQPNSLTREVLTRIRETAWLPITGNHWVSPENIIYLPMLGDLPRQLIRSAKQDLGYYDSSALIETVKQHKGFKQLLELECFAAKTDGVTLLALVAASDEANFVGPTIEMDSVAEWLQIFGSHNSILPGGLVLNDVYNKMGAAAYAEMAKELSKPLVNEKQIKVINHLVDIISGLSGAKKQAPKRLLAAYLKQSVSVGEEFHQDILPKLFLLNENGKSKPANRLCYGYLGIDKDFLVDAEIARVCRFAPSGQLPIITGTQSVQKGGAITHDLAQVAQQLQAYFEPWATVIEQTEIGGFLALLGDDPHMTDLAQFYLGKRSLNNIRQLFDMPVIKADKLIRASGDGETFLEQLSYHTATVVINDPAEPISAVSITRQVFQAKSALELESLLIGSLPRSQLVKQWDKLNIPIQLAKINLANYQRGDLSRLIRNTARIIFREIFNREPQNFADVWDKEIATGDQLDLEVAQQWLVRQSPFYLKQLGLGKSSPFDKILNALARLEHTEIENKVLKSRNPSAETIIVNYEATLNDIKQHLVDVAGEGHTQSVKAVRAKVASAQYSATSILFELFQNADDTVTNLVEPNMTIAPQFQRFVIIENNDTLTICHWGRLINQTKVGDIDGTDKGWGADLENMLTLHNSDKGGDETVTHQTGKFGLGFKSVFLLSERPRILSGRLGFEIISGFYPKRLDDSDRDRMNAQIHDLSTEPNQRATLIELPLLPDSHTRYQEAVQSFTRLAPYLALFARQIRSIELRDSSRQATTVLWRPNLLLPNLAHWETGSLSTLTDAATQQILVCRTNSATTCMVMGANGFMASAAEIPTLWVTAPTQEKLNAGILVNAPFDLDPGRAQLSRVEAKNMALAGKAGRQLAEDLSQLFVMSQQNWSAFCDSLFLSPGLTHDAFWESLWDVVVVRAKKDDNSPAQRVINEFLFGDNGAIRSLVNRHACVPTGLPSPHPILTGLGSIKYYLDGLLEKIPDLLALVIKLDVANDTLLSGSVVAKRIYDKWPSIEQSNLMWRPLTLKQVLERLIPNNHNMEPELTLQLKDILVDKYINKADDDESKELKRFLSELRFLCADRHWRVASSLVVANTLDQDNSDDETLRAAFAPLKFQLHSDYASKGTMEVFKVCRGNLDADSARMADWALEDISPDMRRAVLTYLVDGALAKSLTEKLLEHANYEGSWLANVKQDGSFQQLDSHKKNIVLGRLKLESDAPDSTKEPLPIAPPHDFGQEIKDLSRKWVLYKNSAEDGYVNSLFYPSWAQHGLVELQKNPYDANLGWMTLFIAGLTYGLGWFKPGRTREFLEVCQKIELMDVVGSKDPKSDDWMKVLDNFIDSKLEGFSNEPSYASHMRLFVTIYQIRRHLKEYREIFLSVEKLNRTFYLDDLIRSRTSSIFGGTGYRAPDLVGMTVGAHYVMRELMRLGVVTTPFAHKHCFVPAKRVREWFGCSTSIEMYEKAKQHLGATHATFDYCFDIPINLRLDNKL